MKLNLKFDLSKHFKDLSEISIILKKDYSSISENVSKKSKKLKNWINTLDNILLKHENIQINLRSSIEKELSIKFKKPNLITLALFRPSTKNIFTELSIYFHDEYLNTLYDEKFEFMSNLGDIAEGLALLGDSALDLAVTHTLWKEGITDKGTLTIEKAQLVQNLNLAKFCDEIDLYHNRIHMELNAKEGKPEKINHIKATLVEAIIGIVYLEKGLQGVINFLKKLRDK